jgi:hypothetical protein
MEFHVLKMACVMWPVAKYAREWKRDRKKDVLF